MKNNFFYFTGGLLFLLSLNSCVSYDTLVNFNTGPQFPDSAQAIRNLPVLKIQADDLLSIRVKVFDEALAIPYNIDPENAQGGNNLQNTRALTGYLVDKEGFIDFPQLGPLQVAGKTTSELKKEIEEKLMPFLKDPVVVVRFINFRITILGEISRPGTYTIPNERISIFDAIGQAGDMTVYANRTNVLLIREQDGLRQYIRLNLQDRDIFTSPYFYLVQNDLIYIEPEEIKVATVRDKSQQIAPWISVAGTIVSLIIAIISLTK